MARRTTAVKTPPRQAERFAHYRDLSIHYEGTSAEIPVRAPDLSTRGMFINTAHHFPEGAVLTISFRLSRTAVPVTARGEVRYCLAGVGIGVEFTELSPSAERAILEEVSANGVEVGAP